MSFTAADVTDAARDFHATFTPTTAPPAVCNRFLERYAQDLVGKIANVRSQALVRTTLVTALPLAVFASGITIPQFVLVDDVTYLGSGGTSPTDDRPVTLVPWEQRFRADVNWPSASLNGQTLILFGVAGSWAGSQSVTVRYVPVPTVTTAASVIALPDSAKTVCVIALADFLCGRSQGMEGAPKYGTWADQYAAAEEALLARIQHQTGVEDVRVMDVYGDNGGWSDSNNTGWG